MPYVGGIYLSAKNCKCHLHRTEKNTNSELDNISYKELAVLFFSGLFFKTSEKRHKDEDTDISLSSAGSIKMY